ncbi:MAG TPA: hypothetical protein VGF32_02565 [Streptosporangiaceae bacterium]|jgi:hypothetical protein
MLALYHWAEIDGYAASRNMPDLRDLPVERFCNFVWWYATRNAESRAEVDKLRAQLWRPPPAAVRSAPAVGPWSPAAETAAIGALKSALGVGSVPKAGREPSRPPELPAVRQGRGI